MEMIENTSGLVPLGRAVLCKPFQPEIKESVIALPKAISERQQMIDQRVRVIAVGPACWPDEPARAKPGDLVLVAKMSGFFASTDVTLDNESYLIVNDRDIFCGITAKENDHV